MNQRSLRLFDFRRGRQDCLKWLESSLHYRNRQKGSKLLNPLDPFYEVDPVRNGVNEMFEVIPSNQDNISSFQMWLNNVFEILNDFK